MANVSNKYVVDRCVDVLANLYKNEIFRKNKLGNSVDFSGLSELIMSAVEQGNLEQIEPIINSFIETKISNFDRVAGEKAKFIKEKNMDSILIKHKKVVEDMRGFSKKWASQCAQAITQNVKVVKTQAQSFREGLSNFKGGDEEPAKQISMDEALQRNAQSLYEKTGKMPEGYILNKDGHVIKERLSEENLKEDNKENKIDDMEL